MNTITNGLQIIFVWKYNYFYHQRIMRVYTTGETRTTAVCYIENGLALARALGSSRTGLPNLFRIAWGYFQKIA